MQQNSVCATDRKIEGTITRRTRFGRVACLQIQNDRVFVERAVFEDLRSLRPGVELEITCFENEKNRLIATAVTVLRYPPPQDFHEQQLHDGFLALQAAQSDEPQIAREDPRNWRYRKPT